MKRDSPETLDLLAGEYVMGTLQGQARQRFEAWLRGDPLLRRRVAAWEARLGRLTDEVPLRQPPARVWERIEREIGTPTPDHGPARKVSLWESTPFSRSFAIAASLLVAVLGGLLTLNGTDSRDWGSEIVLHVQEEPEALQAQQVVSRNALADALSRVHLKLTGDLGEATFLGHCVVGDRMGLHFVVSTPAGRATVIVLPGLEIPKRKAGSTGGYSVAVLPLEQEVGTVQPVAEIAALARARGVLVHSDAAQSVGKVPVDVDALGVDLLTLDSEGDAVSGVVAAMGIGPERARGAVRLSVGLMTTEEEVTRAAGALVAAWLAGQR